MTTRLEKERLKAQQEKFQAILSNLLKDEDNKYCVDCDAKGPRWASWNLGIFLCIRCAGIHRNLGVHISKVKSVNLDTWTPEQIANMMEMGNSRGRAVYEANLPDNYRRPQTDSALESFIRAKYETKKYIAKEWVPPKVTVPKELIEDDRDKKKTKPKATNSVQLASVPKSQPAPVSTQSVSSKPAESRPVQSAQSTINTPQQPAKAPPPVTSSNTADLIGLDAPSGPVQNNSNSLLGDLDDFMGASIPQSTTSQQNTSTNNQVSNGNAETDFFGESSSSTSTEPKASTKDSIMALYGGSQTQQQFGVPVQPKASTKDSIMALYGGSQTQQQFGVPATNYMTQYDGVGGVMATSHILPSDTASMYSYTDTGGMYMPQQNQQQIPQQNMGAMFGMNQMNQMNQMPMQQKQNMGAMFGMNQMNQMNQMPMQQAMYGNQMGMMGMQQGPMGNTGTGMPQNNMMRPQGNMGMFGVQQQQQHQQQQQQLQQMQFQQMQQQMAGMRLGQPGMVQNGIPAGQGWGGQSTGQTLSTNLWQ